MGMLLISVLTFFIPHGKLSISSLGCFVFFVLCFYFYFMLGLLLYPGCSTITSGSPVWGFD